MEQVINGDTTEYLYDAANRLAQLNGQAVYSFDNNGNLLNSDTLTNTFDAANRLVETQRDGNTVQPIYNGVNDRVGQVTAGVTTTFALDIAGGLPEVIYTSEDNVYLHLPGVIMAESSTGEIRYLLSDGLGSVRQAVDENAGLVAYHEFDPYGNPVDDSGGEPYGYTGEWWENEVGLLHLRARWYDPEVGRFITRDPSELEENLYEYAKSNPIRFGDPSGNVFVTFDDGPLPNDARILDILRSHNAKATFFFHGEQVDLRNLQDIEIVWRVAAEGHRLANHAFTQPTEGFDTLCMEDTINSLNSTEGVIRSALLQVRTLQPARYQALPPTERDYVDNVIEKGTGIFRPPGGKLTAAQEWQLECMQIVSAPGGSYPVRGKCNEAIPGPYNISWWTVDPFDWAIDDDFDDSNITLSEAAELIYQHVTQGRYNSVTILGADVPLGKITPPLLGPSRFGSYGVLSNSDNILFHSDSEPTVEALDPILQWLKRQNYTFDLVEPSWSTKN